VLDDELLAAVDLPVGQPALQARGPGERGVAAGVDEPGRGDVDGAVAGGEAGAEDTVAVTLDAGEGGVGEDPDAVGTDGVLDPAAEAHLVVADGEGVAGAAEQVAAGLEVGEHGVEHAVGQLPELGTVAVDPAEQPDQRVDHLPAEDGGRVDEDDVAAEAGGLDGGPRARRCRSRRRRRRRSPRARPGRRRAVGRPGSRCGPAGASAGEAWLTH
jgi:hypothetical protein